MPNANVLVPYAFFLDRCTRHDQVVAGLGRAEPLIQRLVAELVMMRLFDEFQEALGGVAARLVCGAPYLDGSSPSLLVGRATSTTNAVSLMRTHNRSTAFPGLKWSKVSYINGNTKHVLDGNDNFTTAVSAHAVIIAEMQAVRNRIAHKNENARTAFARVVRRRYGATRNNVSPGLLLITSRFRPTLLEQYVASCRIILKGCVKA